MAIDLKSNKQQWLMLTNGTDIFSRQEIREGSRITIGTPGIFAIFADTEEELLAKVFVDPSEGLTDYNKDTSLIKVETSESSVDPETGEVIEGEQQEVTLSTPKENLVDFKTPSYCEECCEVLSFEPA
jgi:nitrite reductase/ring-hydroxylating ferredoxin subunit